MPESALSLFRGWAAVAAQRALIADHPSARDRCTRAASIWKLVVEAIESGDDHTARALTTNVLIFGIDRIGSGAPVPA